MRVRLVADADHYSYLVQDLVAKAKVSVWIATANVKEMRIEAPIGTRARAQGKYVSILETLAGLARAGVELRLLYSAMPSRPFRAALAKLPVLTQGGLAMRHCPRVHLKVVAVDGRHLYLGSANFTGAGLGAKGEGRRNFEMGLVTDDDVLLDSAQARFEAIWSGRECKGCRVRGLCPKPLDTLSDSPRKLAEIGVKMRSRNRSTSVAKAASKPKEAPRAKKTKRRLASPKPLT